MEGTSTEDNKNQERDVQRKDRLNDRAEQEQKAKADAKYGRSSSSSKRRSSRTSKSPKRTGKASSGESSRRHHHSSSSTSRHRSRSRDADESLVHHNEAAKSSRRSSLSSSGRKQRMKERTETEQATKRAAKRKDPKDDEVADVINDRVSEENIDADDANNIAGAGDDDAELRKAKRAARNRSRISESMSPPGRKSSRSGREDIDKAAMPKGSMRSTTGGKLSRSRRDDNDKSAILKGSMRSSGAPSNAKPGVERVKHRSRNTNMEHNQNSSMLSPERDNEVPLHATSVEDENIDGPVDLAKVQTNNDVEQHLDEVIQENEKETPEESPSGKTSIGRWKVFLVFLVGLGIGVATGYLLRGGCEQTCPPCETNPPTPSPTAQVTESPTTAAPTIDFAYDPPSEEDCIRIQNALPVKGESEMTIKTFDILVDTSLTDRSLEPTNWPEVLAEAMAYFLIPDLVGCSPAPGGSDKNETLPVEAQTTREASTRQRQLRNIRYVIANAIATGERRNYKSCEDGAPEPCYKAAVTLSLLLKGDEPNVSLFTLISDVILEYDAGVPLVDKFGLSKTTFAFVNIVGMEEVPYEPPSRAACEAIANQLPVPDQESMINNKIFDVVLDVTRADVGITEWLPELTQGIEEHLIPELACCTGDGIGDGTADDSGRRLKELSYGRNLRCVVGNAIATATEDPEVPCQPGRGGAQCVHTVVNLEVSLKGDELNQDIADFIANVISGNTGVSIVDRYGFSTNVFSEINLVVVESKNPTEAPTLFPTPSPSQADKTLPPTDSPSSNPTLAPVVGPTTEPPTSTPSQNPTRAPTFIPTRLTTAQPTFIPTRLATAQPVNDATLAPTRTSTPGPTIQESLRPSSFPSTVLPSGTPTATASESPSTIPTAVTSATPSFAPSPVTRAQFINAALNARFESLDAEALDWILNTDDWFPGEGEGDAEILFVERYTAALFYFKTGGGGWTRTTNWLSNESICSWYEVKCSDSNRVERLEPNDIGLVGELPMELAALESLLRLSCHDSSIGDGKFPESILGLTSLTSLGLSNAGSFRTSIPTEIGRLTNLKGLNLSRNDFTGAVPSELGLLTTLRLLELNGNSLAGSLPSELASLTAMEVLLLHNLSIGGTLPEWIGDSFVVLQEIAVENCGFTGTLPPNVFQPSLTVLNLSHNQFTGKLPNEILQLSVIANLYLEQNQLTGTIPDIISTFSSLKRLQLGENNFSGTIPDLSQLSSITRISLQSNNLVGTLPSVLGLVALTSLVVRNNQLTGNVPTMPPSIQGCSLGNNNFSDTTNAEGICSI